MAAYPIYQPQFGIYNPNNFSKQPTTGDALTVDTAKLYFLQFPNAQTSQTEYLNSIGVASDATFNGPVVFNETVTYNQDIEFLANVVVDGTATVTGNLLCDSTATITDTLTCEGGIDISTLGTGLTFPDNTTQTTAFIEANYAQLNTDNIFLTGFTQTFNGAVNLNGDTNGVTQLSGNTSTLLATTEFVQNAVQVSGVQVTDSPLLWSGANTNQYNAGTGLTLPYSYPYGLSQLYNLSGGNEEFSLVANNGVTGASDNAFRIYCTQGNQTGTLLQGTTPQLILSNNGTAAFIKDGINVNNMNVSNISTLTGNSTSAINVSSPLSLTTGNNLYINDGILYLFSGTTNTNIYYSGNQVSFNNGGSYAGNAGFNFALYNNAPTPFLQTYLNIQADTIDIYAPFNLHNNSLTGVNVINPNTNGSTISFQDYSANILTLNYLGINAYENLTMNASNIVMGNNNISGIGILTGTGLGDITVNSGLNFSTGGGINMGNGGLLNCTSIAGNSTTDRVSFTSDIYINAANVLYTNTIVPTTSQLELASGTVLSFNPPPGSNDTSVATTNFVNSVVNGVSFTQTNQSTQLLGTPAGVVNGTMFSNSNGINQTFISQTYAYSDSNGTTNPYFGVTFSTPVYPTGVTPIVTNNSSYIYFTSGATGTYISLTPILNTQTSWDMYKAGNVPGGAGQLVMQFTITW